MHSTPREQHGGEEKTIPKIILKRGEGVYLNKKKKLYPIKTGFSKTGAERMRAHRQDVIGCA